MLKTFRNLAVAAAVATLPMQAAAQEFGTGDLGFGLGVSTLGVTGEVSFQVNPNLTVRGLAGFARVSGSERIEEEDIIGDFTGRVNIGGAGPVVDYHPFANGLRVSVGALASNYRINADATDLEVEAENMPGNFNVGDASARIRTRSPIMPKLAVGFDSSRAFGTALGISADAGVLYTNGLRTRVNVTGNLDQDDARRVRDEINDAINDLPGRGRFLPYLSVTVGMKF